MSDSEESENSDIYDSYNEHDERSKVFDHVNRRHISMTSNILVEDLLENDKELLALFYIVRTCIGVGYQKTNNKETNKKGIYNL